MAYIELQQTMKKIEVAILETVLFVVLSNICNTINYPI